MADGTETKRVVAIAVDQSPHSDQAFKFYLENLQRPGDYCVFLHVPEVYDLADASPAAANKLMHDLKAQVAALEQKYMNTLKEKDPNLKGKMCSQGGKPGEVVCTLAEEERANIIVCGTRGQGKIRRTILGSVSDCKETRHDSDSIVHSFGEEMAEQQEAGSDHKRVVVIAVDQSPHSDQAFNFYLENVQKPCDFCVLLHIPEMYDLTDASPAVADRLIKEKKTQVTVLEEKYMDLLKNKHAHLKGKFRTSGGKPGETICKLAEEEGAAIIVCGTRGQGTIRRTIMGSVSDYIVHHAHVPVLVCRSKTLRKERA